jgi:hypothetical protein
MPTLMSRAKEAAGNINNQLQRTAGSVNRQLQATTNNILPPQQREQKINELRTFSHRNPKLAVGHATAQTCPNTDMSTGISRSSSSGSRFSNTPVPWLRCINSPHLLSHVSAHRYHHCSYLYCFCCWLCPVLPCSYSLHGQLRGDMLLPLGSLYLFHIAAIQYRSSTGQAHYQLWKQLDHGRREWELGRYEEAKSCSKNEWNHTFL